MMRIFPQGRSNRSRSHGRGAGVRPVRVSFISLTAALASVLVMSVAAGACTVNSTQPYSVTSNVNTGGTAISGTLTAPAYVYDTAVLSDTSGSVPVIFNLYKGTCSGSVSSVPSGWIDQTTTNNNVSPARSAGFGPLSAGSYYFISYTSYNSSPYTCEPFTVKSTSSLNTTPSVSGFTATDSASVTGTSGTPTGTVTFTLYSGTSPSGTLVAGYSDANVALVNGSAPSTSTGTLAVGSYYFMVTYSGDGTYLGATGTAEAFTISNPGCTSGCGGGGGGSPTDSITTTPNVTGNSATDSATVSGSAGTPTGTVTFVLYSGTPGSGTVYVGFAADTATLNGSGSASSVSTGALQPGNYYFLVTYSGDATYSAITSTAATPEPFGIDPTLSTTPNVTGTSATDTATVTGTKGTPTGTVTFTLYSGAPGSGTLVASFPSDTATLSNGTATSNASGTLAAGDYYFMVTYSGDGSYAAVSPGSPEPFTVISTSAPGKGPTYKIPKKAPQTGAGGSAGVVFNGGLLALGSSMLIAGLMAMALMFRRRRLA